LAIIEDHLGQQFDAAFGDHLLRLGRSGALEPIVGHSDEGIPLQDCPMCGPTLVLRRDQSAGDRVYCRNCRGEFVIEPIGETLYAHPTGRRGSPQAVEPEADVALISRLVRESAQHLVRSKVFVNAA
jgi:hypothetical protein